MAVTVISFATYLTRDESPWRSDDYNALKFIQAIKGEPINKWAWVPVGGISRRLDQDNADDALEWFGELAADYLNGKKLVRPVFLVPIPNSPCTAANGKVPRTARLAKAIADRMQNVTVLDCLRWKKVMPSARKGGSRDPQVLYENMTIKGDVSKGRVVLVDDVSTTGAHLQAAAAKIVNEGGKCVLAICAGRTVLCPEEEPFSVLEQKLQDFVPR